MCGCSWQQRILLKKNRREMVSTLLQNGGEDARQWYVNSFIEPFHSVYRFQNIMLHMANMHTFIFQLKDKILKEE